MNFIFMYILCGVILGVYFTQKMLTTNNEASDSWNDITMLCKNSDNWIDKAFGVLTKCVVFTIVVVMFAAIWPYAIINVSLKKIINR